jgi:hypothetical protein
LFKNSFLILEENIDKKVGKVKYFGSKNESYVDTKWFDDVDIYEGNEVVFRNEIEVLLEDKSHFKLFNEELRWAQRKDVLTLL